MKIINDVVFGVGLIIGFILGVLGIDLRKGDLLWK